MKTKIAIIGGGPAGLSAAVAARKAGVEDILILERDEQLGGILNQCIHNGFGLHTFQEELTGPEYAARFIAEVEEMQIPYLLSTMVVDISPEKKITCMNRERGMFVLEAEAIILAMGCRERPRGALNIPGYRPAGIYSAGTAQRYVNIEGRMPGEKVVILGSGDIGLIMARRMTFEGAKVQVVAELMPYSGGLKRNIVQCLDDYDIPLKLSHTVVDIKGKDRVEAVTIAQENELSGKLGVELSTVTSGPIVNERLETNIPGVFACGNVLHVHDLVDYVSEEAGAAGTFAAEYVTQQFAEDTTEIAICPEGGVRYTVPSSIHPHRMQDKQIVRFRVGNVYKNSELCVYFDDSCIMRLKKKVMAPGEMEQVILQKKKLQEYENLSKITIRIEQGEA